MKFFAKILLVVHLLVSVGFAENIDDAVSNPTPEPQTAQQEGKDHTQSKTYTIEQLQEMLEKGQAQRAYYAAVQNYIQTSDDDPALEKAKKEFEQVLKTAQALGLGEPLTITNSRTLEPITAKFTLYSLGDIKAIREKYQQRLPKHAPNTLYYATFPTNVTTSCRKKHSAHCLVMPIR